MRWWRMEEEGIPSLHFPSARVTLHRSGGSQSSVTFYSFERRCCPAVLSGSGPWGVFSELLPHFLRKDKEGPRCSELLSLMLLVRLSSLLKQR